MSSGRRLAVLREPDYRRLWLGRTASLVGDGMSPVALAFAVLDLTGSPTDLGIVLAAHGLVITALVLVGGVFAAELRQGWQEFSRRSWLVAVVVSAAISNALFFPAFQVLGPTVAREHLGGAGSWALIAALWGVGGVLGGGLALGVRPRRPLLLGESVIVIFALPVALLAIPAATGAIALGALVGGTAIGLGEVLYETATAQNVPREALSRVAAYDWFGSLALEPLGLLAVGPVAAGIGTSTTLWLAAAIVTLCQVAVLLVPSVRRLEFHPEATGPLPPPRPLAAGD